MNKLYSQIKEEHKEATSYALCALVLYTINTAYLYVLIGGYAVSPMGVLIGLNGLSIFVYYYVYGIFMPMDKQLQLKEFINAEKECRQASIYD